MSSSRLRICACTDTSSADTGSSQMISFGSVIDGARDRDALALPAGELVRSPVAGAVGIEADRVEHLVDLAPPRAGVADAPDVEALGDDVADLAARVQRRDRVLEDHLHAGPGPPQRVALQLGELDAVEADPARGGAGELHDRAAGRRLPAPGLADQAERLALDDVEADARHRLHPAAVGVELDDEILDPQQHVALGAEVGGAGAGHQNWSIPLRRPGLRPRLRSISISIGRFRYGVPASGHASPLHQLVDSARRPGLRPRLRAISISTGRFRYGVPASGHASATLRSISISSGHLVRARSAWLRARAASPSGVPTGNQQRNS